MEWPSATDIESHAKSLLAVSAIIGGAWAFISRWRRRRRASREMRSLEAKSLRYLVDAMHHVLDVITPSSDGRMTDVSELIRQNVLIRDVRKELWAADGHAESVESEIIKVLTRTQAIKRLKEQRDIGGDENCNE